MRKRPNRALEKFRIREGDFASNNGDWHGAFEVDSIRIIAGAGDGWEHVSVSHIDKTPSWATMCQVKAWFWGPEEEVFQFHPPESTYVNFHPFCLHLWKPIGVEIPLPDPMMVRPR